MQNTVPVAVGSRASLDESDLLAVASFSGEGPETGGLGEAWRAAAARAAERTGGQGGGGQGGGRGGGGAWRGAGAGGAERRGWQGGEEQVVETVVAGAGGTGRVAALALHGLG